VEFWPRANTLFDLYTDFTNGSIDEDDMKSYTKEFKKQVEASIRTAKKVCRCFRIVSACWKQGQEGGTAKPKSTQDLMGIMIREMRGIRHVLEGLLDIQRADVCSLFFPLLESCFPLAYR
jgi:hypothetical protein